MKKIIILITLFLLFSCSKQEETIKENVNVDTNIQVEKIEELGKDKKEVEKKGMDNKIVNIEEDWVILEKEIENSIVERELCYLIDKEKLEEEKPNIYIKLLDFQNDYIKTKKMPSYYYNFENICLNEDKWFFIANSKWDSMAWIWWEVLKYNLNEDKWFIADRLNFTSWLPEEFISNDENYIIYKWVFWAALVRKEKYFLYDIKKNIIKPIYRETYSINELNNSGEYNLSECIEFDWYNKLFIENKCKLLIKDYFETIWKQNLKIAYSLKYQPTQTLEKFIEIYKGVENIEFKSIEDLWNFWYKTLVIIDWIKYESSFKIVEGKIKTINVKVIN